MLFRVNDSDDGLIWDSNMLKFSAPMTELMSLRKFNSVVGGFLLLQVGTGPPRTLCHIIVQWVDGVKAECVLCTDRGCRVVQPLTDPAKAQVVYEGLKSWAIAPFNQAEPDHAGARHGDAGY